jgi:hypothetical protein
MKSHTHLEVWNVDGTILDSSDENAAPFTLNIGEQIIVGERTHEVVEIIDTDPHEVDRTVYYRRVVRVK